MMNVLFVDYDKCVGCELCVMRCSLEKTGTCNPARSRIHVLKQEEEGITMPVMCRHCEEPPCIPVCPVDAISKDKEMGLVQIDSDTCIGGKLCVEACPYGGPVGVPLEVKNSKGSSTIKVICDLCNGHPACVESCPTGALQFISRDEANLKRSQQSMEKLTECWL